MFYDDKMTPKVDFWPNLFHCDLDFDLLTTKSNQLISVHKWSNLVHLANFTEWFMRYHVHKHLGCRHRCTVGSRDRLKTKRIQHSSNRGGGVIMNL